MNPQFRSARAVSRRLGAPADLLALYAALSDGGRRADTMLLETTAGASIILDRAAVRIACRGQNVTIDSLSAGGSAVLRVVERVLPERVAASDASRLQLRFERSEEMDSRLRLDAPSPFDVLRAVLRGMRSDTPEEPFTVLLGGVVAFDHVDLFEDLPANAEDPAGFPDLVFWLAESAVIAEPGLMPRLVCSAFSAGSDDDRRAHFAAVELLGDLERRCADAVPVPVAKLAAPQDPETDLDDAAYAEVVIRLKEHVAAGDVYQIVPSRTFSTPCARPLAAFARLRASDRSPYMFFVSQAGSTMFGSSPETSVRVLREGGHAMIEVKPIAGTRPRGLDPDEDDRMEADLRLDQKEVAEHMMLVDLARNDVAQVSEPGTRRVHQLMIVERFARVMHLVSSVKGRLGAGLDALHALQACLNVGTLSGAPKLRATELLRRFERTRRGPYGGAIGWLNGEGAMDTGVVIRSALVRDGIAYVRAGAGVVHDSDPKAEADETRRKASAVLSAIAAAEGAET